LKNYVFTIIIGIIGYSDESINGHSCAVICRFLKEVGISEKLRKNFKKTEKTVAF
jgi:hypothetical protein